MFNPRIAAAVSAAISLTAAAGAFAGPTPATANGAAHRIFVAGSSAAASGFINYVENQLCNTAGWSTFNTPTTAAGLPDFRAVSCSTSTTAAVFPSSTLTVWYRAEGGSAIGVLPLLNNVTIKQLDLGSASAGCSVVGTTGVNTAYSCTGVTGTASANGTADSWGGAVLAQNIDVGVSDLEPTVFGTLAGSSLHAVAGGGNHDPFGTYSTALTGTTNLKVSDISSRITTTPVFQQTFGFAVSTGLGITDLPKAQIASIFDGTVTDWSNVGTSANTKVKPTATPIIVCNREIGSGTRAAADIFLNGTGCSNVGANAKLKDFATTAGQPADNLQTFAELDCVNTHANAIGYASIDNLTAAKIAATWPAINAIAVDGVVPSLNASGLGAYEFVFEAAVNQDPTPSTDGNLFYQAVSLALQDVNTTSTSAQVSAIPNLDVNGDNVATVPLTKGSVAPNTNVPVSDFTRAANSCTPLNHG
jgi:ABC-type phosphate transport system substrate-binding protein